MLFENILELSGHFAPHCRQGKQYFNHMDEKASCGEQTTAKTTLNNPQTKNRENQPQSDLNNTISPNGKSSKFTKKLQQKLLAVQIQSWQL